MKIKFFNKIPNDWEMMGLGGFSKILKAFLIKTAYYSIEEFWHDNIAVV